MNLKVLTKRVLHKISPPQNDNLTWSDHIYKEKNDDLEQDDAIYTTFKLKSIKINFTFQQKHGAEVNLRVH